MDSVEIKLSKVEEVVLMEPLRQSPKAKASKTSTLRRRKRPLVHLRAQHLEEALSPVTTPTDDEVIHRIKHVAGQITWQHEERVLFLWGKKLMKNRQILRCLR